MKRLSTRAWAYVCIGLLLVLAVVFSLVNRRMQAQISDDPLSKGIAERWNAALPAGFAKECAGQITDGAGLQFARLVYDKDIGGLLAKWTPPDEAAQAELDALIDAFLPNASPEEAAWLRGARPVLAESWVFFSLVGEEDARDVILLAYRAADRVMFLAERQV